MQSPTPLHFTKMELLKGSYPIHVRAHVQGQRVTAGFGVLQHNGTLQSQLLTPGGPKLAQTHGLV